jgi:hypothetical protein
MESQIAKLNDLIKTCNLRELNDFINIINVKIKDLKNQELLNKIKNDLKLNGYAWTVSPDVLMTFENHAPAIFETKFPLFIDISTWDKEDKTDLHVRGLSGEQHDWVDYVEFNWCPSDEDDFKVRDGRWSYGDWDDPVYGQAIIMIRFFFQKHQVPKEGSCFTAFDEEGNYEEWNVDQSKLYCQGRYFGPLDQWNKYDIFVIDNELDQSDS